MGGGGDTGQYSIYSLPFSSNGEECLFPHDLSLPSSSNDLRCRHVPISGKWVSKSLLEAGITLWVVRYFLFWYILYRSCGRQQRAVNSGKLTEDVKVRPPNVSLAHRPHSPGLQKDPYIVIPFVYITNEEQTFGAHHSPSIGLKQSFYYVGCCCKRSQMPSSKMQTNQSSIQGSFNQIGERRRFQEITMFSLKTL